MPRSEWWIRLSAFGLRALDRHVERIGCQPGFEMIVECPADDLAAERIEHDRQIDEGFAEPDIGNVGDPDLVDHRSARDRGSGWARPRSRVGSSAVLAATNGRLAQAQQIILAHQPEHALGVDDPVLRAAAGSCDPPVSVERMLEANALELVAQLAVGRLTTASVEDAGNRSRAAARPSCRAVARRRWNPLPLMSWLG